jgi:hypothetical protein
MHSIYSSMPQRKRIFRVKYSFVGVLYIQINASCIIIVIINIILLPQTSHVSRYRLNFAAILWLQHTVHLMLFPILNVFYIHITTFPHNCTVPSISCCTYFFYVLLSWYVAQVLSEYSWDGSSSGMLRRFCLSDFEII